MYVGAWSASTDAAGNLSFEATFPVSVPEGWVVTSTALRAGVGSTSEFSKALSVVTAAPRVTGSTFAFEAAPQMLLFDFDQDVSTSLSLLDVEVQDLTHGTTITPAGISYNPAINQAVIRFADVLPDANFRVRLTASGITNSAGTPMAADHLFDFFFLNGDANHDRHVDVTDLGILATNWHRVGATFSQADFNYDHVVDVSDLGILATSWSRFLAAPATRTAPARSPRADKLIDTIGDAVSEVVAR
jgi:hypothetical protein